MLDIFVAILVFGFIVLVHEFGHFLFAKLNGISVLEFSIGMGPRLCSVVRGETRYSIKVLPFGGSCMMMGEDGGEEQAPGAFTSKPVLARIAVIAAGPVFNFILAFLFAMILVGQMGYADSVLSVVAEGSPAAEAGLLPGDKIVKIGNRKVTTDRDVSWYLVSHPGETVSINVWRPLQMLDQIQVSDDQVDLKAQQPEAGVWEKDTPYQTLTLQLTPRFYEEYGSYMIGVSFPGERPVDSLGKLVYYSAYEVKFCVMSTFDSLRMLFTKQVRADEAMAGPIRIVSMVSETVETGREAGARVLILFISNWILLLSTSLGIMNLLPIPALDGGRLVFLLLELVRGKPIDPEKEGMVHMAGMMLLMALMVMVLFNDIRNLL